MGFAGNDPITNPQAWDIVKLAGVDCPGLAEVRSFKRAHEFDVKKGKGVYGATLTFIGRPPARGSIKFLLWTAAQFAAWDQFVLLLKYDPTKKAVKPVDIYHPSLAFADITSVVTENIGAPEHDGQGLYWITVDFIEYFPPPNVSAISTPSGAAQTVPQAGLRSGTPPPDANAQLQAEISSLMTQATAP